GVLQLRASQNGNGAQNSVRGLSTAGTAEKRPPRPCSGEPQIDTAHGAGGKASRRLVEGLFAPLLFASSSEPLGDAAHLDFNDTRIAINNDSFVVKALR